MYKINIKFKFFNQTFYFLIKTKSVGKSPKGKSKNEIKNERRTLLTLLFIKKSQNILSEILFRHI